jgi:carbon monoxide dehydrogenase subunit G
MASLHKEVRIDARPDDIWDAVRDIGALHTRLVPGFVVDTRLEGDVRVVTFGNGMVVREPILSLDDKRRRIAWLALGGRATHYSASLQVFAEGAGSRVVWITDFLPHELAGAIDAMLGQGLEVMKKTLEKAAARVPHAPSQHSTSRN